MRMGSQAQRPRLSHKHVHGHDVLYMSVCCEFCMHRCCDRVSVGTCAQAGDQPPSAAVCPALAQLLVPVKSRKVMKSRLCAALLPYTHAITFSQASCGGMRSHTALLSCSFASVCLPAPLQIRHAPTCYAEASSSDHFPCSFLTGVACCVKAYSFWPSTATDPDADLASAKVL